MIAVIASHFHDDSFQSRLAMFMLEAYAAGTDLEGTWDLPDDDAMTPDVSVAIERVNESSTPDVATNGDGDGRRRRDTSDPFGSALRTFLLREFGDDSTVEGSWTVRFDREQIPTWTVEIELGDVELPFELE